MQLCLLWYFIIHVKTQGGSRIRLSITWHTRNLSYRNCKEEIKVKSCTLQGWSAHSHSCYFSIILISSSLRLMFPCKPPVWAEKHVIWLFSGSLACNLIQKGSGGAVSPRSSSITLFNLLSTCYCIQTKTLINPELPFTHLQPHCWRMLHQTCEAASFFLFDIMWCPDDISELES